MILQLKRCLGILESWPGNNVGMPRDGQLVERNVKDEE